MAKAIVGTFPSTIEKIIDHTSAAGNPGFRVFCMGTDRPIWVSKAEQEGGTVDYGNGPEAVAAKGYKVGDIVTINRREDGNYSFSNRDYNKEKEALAYQSTASLHLDFAYQQQLARAKGLAAASVASNPLLQGLFAGQAAPVVA